jgi:phage tail-like protein
LLSPRDSKLTQWMKQSFSGNQVSPIKEISISLLGEDHQSLMHWTINNVWPRSWKIGELNAERGEVLIETLELNYNRLIFENS